MAALDARLSSLAASLRGRIFLSRLLSRILRPDSYGDYGNYGVRPAGAAAGGSERDNGNSAELAAQVQQLTDEVSDLRSEENRRYYDDRSRASSGATLSAKEPAAATVFVFTDGTPHLG